LFAIPCRDCLDGGISTGGFYRLPAASWGKKVYGIDVGYGQVDRACVMTHGF